jgi:hypothetical protein
MALSPDITTRIDQLKADLARVQASHAAAVTVPDTEPLFRTHPDGSAYDRAGNELRGPIKKAP